MQAEEVSKAEGWQALLQPEWIPTLVVLLGGVLLQSMNILLLATVLPSIVDEVGGVAMLSWPTTAYLASSIIAASCTGILANMAGTRSIYCAGAIIFGIGALVCSLATAMGWIVVGRLILGWIVVGRLIQGFGGGLGVAVGYVLVREVLPRSLRSRAIALMSTSWSVSVLLGPLVGGLFAQLGSWRTAFVLTIIIAGILGISALLILPKTSANLPSSRVPGARIALICLAIAIMSWASLVEFAFFKAGLIVLAMISLALMLQLNRSASTALLPRDSFLWGSPTGVGLWLALLLSVSYSPLQIFMPIFLQRLHGFAPLTAGFMVATASLAWTAASVATAGASAKWIDRLMLSGPTVMALSLALMSLLMANSPALLLIAVIALLGAGIGQCWPFVADRIMDGAKPGDETVAASSVATVQQMGFALGAAMAGVVGNASGLSSTIVSGGMARAAFWVPASFVLPAILALLMGLRLVHLRKS